MAYNGRAESRQVAPCFELGPIRPPSEAFSLLIRATRNCPWNKCLFCRTYRGTKFQLRPVEEIIGDIEAARAISDALSGKIDEEEYSGLPVNETDYQACVHNVALWLHAGGRTAFLQDSDTLIMRTSELIRVITYLRRVFPSLNRVTSYARSHTSARKTLQELQELKEAGLDRIHTGLETGYDPLLQYIQKGATAEQHIIGGRKVQEAGISLCEYVMPGLGGREMSGDHALATARALNQINPDYIRLRSLHVRPDSPLRARLEEGDFILQTEDEVVEEIGVLIDNLSVTSRIKSDHVLNLLMEVDGKMPEDKRKIMDVINTYLALPREERLNFRLGRRLGYYEKLSDLHDVDRHAKIAEVIEHLGSQEYDVDKVIFELKDSFI